MDDQCTPGTQFSEPPEGLMTAPTDRVVGNLDDPESLVAAAKALGEAGFNRDEIVVLCGEKGAERLDASGGDHGLWGRAYRLMEWSLPAHEVLRAAEQHLKDGGLRIYVPAEEEQKGEASRILHQHGGHDVYYFGKATFVQLGP